MNPSERIDKQIAELADWLCWLLEPSVKKIWSFR
jgi:hypothetical protein